MVKRQILIWGFMLAIACASMPSYATTPLSLKDRFAQHFFIGVSLNRSQIASRDSNITHLVKQHFNSIVSENDMKCQVIHPEENRYNFTPADNFVKFGEENNMAIIGHCLIWHSQCAPWFFIDEKGEQVSPEILKQRMKEHITTLVGRYKGRIKGWDVVNEAIVENGSYRQSPFYQILGEEFIPLAFQYAHEADPEAELYLNDYGMDVPGRREAYVRLIKRLKERGLRIDAIGMQGHMGMDYPRIEEFEKSMIAFAEAGVNVMITEWDMSALPTASQSANISDTKQYSQESNPYPQSLPDSVSHLWNQRMKSFFQLFMRHADIVTRVTAWGVTDGDSWKNNFPVKGRTDYPLLFDREYQLKPFLRELCKEANDANARN